MSKQQQKKIISISILLCSYRKGASKLTISAIAEHAGCRESLVIEHFGTISNITHMLNN